MARGKTSGGLYSLEGQIKSISGSSILSSSSYDNALAFTTIKPTIWHHRLANPSMEVFNKLVLSSLLKCDKFSSKTTCTHCYIVKSHYLSFKNRNASCDTPFALMYMDL